MVVKTWPKPTSWNQSQSERHPFGGGDQEDDEHQQRDDD